MVNQILTSHLFIGISLFSEEIEMHTQKMCKFVLNDIKSYPHAHNAHNLHIALIQGATKRLRQVTAQTLSHFTKQNDLTLSSPLSEAFCHHLYEFTSHCDHVLSVLSTLNTLTPLLAVCVYKQQMAGVLYFPIPKCFFFNFCTN